MKRTFKNGLIFLVLTLVLTSAFAMLLRFKTADNDNFKIGDQYHTIILGNSLAECAFNDSLIPGVKNISQGGESYVYTYLKLRKIHEANPKIKTVILSYSNNHIDETMERLIFDDGNISAYFPKYAFLMDGEEFKLFLQKDILLLTRLAVKNSLLYQVKGGSYLRDNTWGGYFFLEQTKNKNAGKIRNIVENAESLSPTNISYLKKIIAYCNANGLKIHLVRTPLNIGEIVLNNEKTFMLVKDKNFPDVNLLDLVNFPLATDLYTDNEHINHIGAKKVSVFFNGLLEKGVLDSAKPQEMIDAELRNTNSIRRLQSDIDILQD